MRIVVSGPPSVGKSTQAKALAERLGVTHLSSGEIIRSGARSGDHEASRLAAIVSDGSLAPSASIVAMVLSRLAAPDCARGFVVDGFPRRVTEAKALVDRYGTLIDAFVVLEADMDTLMARVRERARQSSLVRADDDPALFPRRVATYLAETRPVRSYVRSKGVPVLVVDANPEVDDVRDAVGRALGFGRDLDAPEDVREAPRFL